MPSERFECQHLDLGGLNNGGAVGHVRACSEYIRSLSIPLCFWYRCLLQMRFIFSPLALTFHSLSLFTVVAAHPNRQSDEKAPYSQDWQMKDLFNGNERFIRDVNAEYPGLIEQTGKKQQPPFMYFGCVDSRYVSLSSPIITSSGKFIWRPWLIIAAHDFSTS